MILRRYLAKQCLSMTLLILFALVALDFFFGLIGNLDGNSFIQALVFMLWRLPEDMNQLIPISGLLGSLLALGQMSRNSELVVMRVAGFSMLKIARAVAGAGFLLAIVLFFNMTLIAPWANQQLRSLNHTGKSNQATLTQVWLRSDHGLVNIQAFWPNGVLTGVSRYEFKEGKLDRIELAQKVRYQNSQWHAGDIKTVDISDKKVTYNSTQSALWQSLMAPKLLTLVATPADELNVVGLWRNIIYRVQNSLNSNQYEFVLWQSIFTPVSAILMMLLAVPFIFGAGRNSSLGFKMMLGILVGFGFFIVNQFVGSLSSLIQLSPLLAASFPSILCILLFVYGVQRLG
ncbi:LPS export ABC transporter permease LptG [Piscirickettsia salmonis]|uniref:Lipopolysaccharide export system permease protein LptG n=1 Tax=Piscirickettsia salmonis TaxID=1238 RepID=A0A9Q5VI14_PISSA|nr:LPS export ABC transporter permease LptG [Piscirickettsia salmonis]RNC78677.1 LPS export ABC transporter permease LptG [Piscirickettsiaceae bacterium NZ-RLO2]ALA25362.1 permease YjgP/YjgQ family protein [Piscirickettsia salmonis]APS45593.1 LPS export ABC transporter permease LptG [Piscirickettsia salmonis]APS46248.1 LPS export ABC transporter permease LptG [Piscirickettsia salmonis]APS50182.1 LPS export ABC transporter permease LptG [Piscirickettsia salmonis]